MSSIKDRVLQIVDFQNEKKEVFFKKIGMTSSNFRAKAKETPLNSDAIANILSVSPQINPQWLLTGEGDMLKGKNALVSEGNKGGKLLPLIPLSAMAGYGNGDAAVSYREIKEGYVIPEFEQRGAMYLIRVNGTSMEPKYSSGDILGCKPINDTTFFQWGKPYVLDTDQGPIFKRLYPTDGDEVLECRSDNATIYPPFKIYKSSIRKVAIVVGVIRME